MLKYAIFQINQFKKFVVHYMPEKRVKQYISCTSIPALHIANMPLYFREAAKEVIWWCPLSLHTVDLFVLEYRLYGKQRVFFWVDIISISIWVWWVAFHFLQVQINGVEYVITDVLVLLLQVQRGKCIIARYTGVVEYHHSVHVPRF